MHKVAHDKKKKKKNKQKINGCLCYRICSLSSRITPSREERNKKKIFLQHLENIEISKQNQIGASAKPHISFELSCILLKITRLVPRSLKSNGINDFGDFSFRLLQKENLFILSNNKEKTSFLTENKSCRMKSRLLHLPIGVEVSVITNPLFCTLWSEWNVITTWFAVTVTFLPVLWPQYVPKVSFKSLLIFR